METFLLIVIAVAGLALTALRNSRRKDEERSGAPGWPAPDGGPQPEAAGKSRKSKPPRETETTPGPVSPAPALGTGPFEGVRTWGYQLQKVNTKQVAASGFDMIVIDYSHDGSDEKAFSPGDIGRMQSKPDGGKRLVMAYMSIGEAERYRYYWDRAWDSAKPAWLLDENPEWKENYAVCYWTPEWQQTFCGSPAGYLDKIIAAGFDGVYLDKCDVFEDLQAANNKVAQSRGDLEGDMVAFVTRLSQYARARKPGFAIIMQNAEVLLEHEALREAIDGVAKESLLYGQPGPEKPNPKDEVVFARNALDLARKAGKTVFVVEYLSEAGKIASAAETVRSYGYVYTASPKNRDLAQLNEGVLTV
jgi:cysteinyl-tRNA synthetase, unknown class